MSEKAHATAKEGARLAIHASTLVIGEDGILIRGPSGSGKSRLALSLVAEASRCGFARLVADDRTLLSYHCGRLVARPHPAIAGLVERRGLGIHRIESEPACRLSLVVDLVEEACAPRMPASRAIATLYGNVELPRFPVASKISSQDAVALILTKLATLTTSS